MPVSLTLAEKNYEVFAEIMEEEKIAFEVDEAGNPLITKDNIDIILSALDRAFDKLDDWLGEDEAKTMRAARIALAGNRLVAIRDAFFPLESEPEVVVDDANKEDLPPTPLEEVIETTKKATTPATTTKPTASTK